MKLLTRGALKFLSTHYRSILKRAFALGLATLAAGTISTAVAAQENSDEETTLKPFVTDAENNQITFGNGTGSTESPVQYESITVGKDLTLNITAATDATEEETQKVDADQNSALYVEAKTVTA